MRTSLFTRPATLISRLDARAAALSGKKGVAVARERAARIREAAQRHERQMNLGRQARSPQAVATTRRMIARSAEQTWRRGEHRELGGVWIPERWRTHPDLRALAAPLTLFERAKRSVLPGEYSRFDRKGRGASRAVELYAFGFGLLLAQVRTTERRHAGGYLSVRKSYFLTDGRDAIEVPSARIKRAAAQDNSPDSPLRALKPALPAEWAERIDAEPLKLAAPAIYARAEAYKIVARGDAPEELVSVYDGSPWPLGEWRRERARREHGGGLYAYADAEHAREAARQGLVFGRAQAAGKRLVLVRCEVGGGGRYVRYGAKLAFNALRPVDVLGEIENA